MHVAELWVYPVKSLAGQRLRRTRIGRDGVPGDRRVQVRDGGDRLLRVGQAVIEVEKVCKRCAITTIDPDTLAVDPDVLRRIERGHGGRFALNCHVAEPGAVAVGDPVELLP